MLAQGGAGGGGFRVIAMASFERVCFAVVVVGLLVLETVVAEQSVAQILEENGLPLGLLPATVQSYTLAANGKFQVNLGSTCTTKIGSEDVYYKKAVTGELSYKQINDLGGIQVRQGWFWFSVTSIEVDSTVPDTLWFRVGYFARSMSTDLFEVSPVCNSLGEGEEASKDAMTFSEWLGKALDGTLEVNLPHSLDFGAARKLLE